MKFIESSKTFLILFVFYFLGVLTVSAQGDTDCENGATGVQLSFDPEQISGEPGDIVCINLEVSGFSDITIFFFIINFNSTVLSYQSVNPLLSGLPSFTANDIIGPFGPDNLDRIRVFWAEPNTNGETLPPESILLEVCFEIVGTPGEKGVVHINSSGLNGEAEFLTSAQQNLPICSPEEGSCVNAIAPFSVEPQGYITSLCGTPLGTSEGVAEITIFNGTGPYTVLDDTGAEFTLGNGINRFIVTDEPVGQRIFRIRDAVNNLSEPIIINFDNAPPFDITATKREPDCPLDINGWINLEVTGGTPWNGTDYFFDWGSEQVGFGSNELRNLINGVYPVQIVDSLGCVQYDTVTLARSEIELIPLQQTDALCPGRASGSLEVMATGGGPFTGGRYTFTIEGVTDDGQIFIDSREEVQVALFSLLPPGEYTITAQDSVDRRMNCADQTPFIIGVERSFDTSIRPGDNSPCNGTDETVEIQITSSHDLDFPLDIEVLDSAGAQVLMSTVNSDVFQPGCLPTGDYTLLVNDAGGCSFESAFSLMGCTLVLTDTTIVQPLCAGDLTGSISISAASPDGPVLYFWSTGDTTNSVSDLLAGDYSVTITDQAACEIIETFTIATPDALELQLGSEPVQCPGGIGQITAIPSGGTGPYQYQWFPNPTGLLGSVLTGIPSGTYTVIVTDANSCAVTDSLTLEEPGMFDVQVTNPTAPICNGQATGTAVVNAFDTPDYTGPFSYLSSSGLNGIGANFSIDNFPAGRNWVIASDGICVSDTVYIDIPVRDPLTLDLNNSIINDVACFGDSGTDGAVVNLVAQGGNGTPISFAWPELGANVTGNVQIGLGADTYTIEMTNAAGCTNTDSITVGQPDSLEVMIDSVNSILALCGGDNSTELSVIHMGGIEDGQFTYLWEDESGATVSMASTAPDLGVGNYFISVTDQNNCTSSITASVTEPVPVVGVVGEVSDPLCFEDLGTISIDTAMGGVPGYRYQVNTSNTMDISEDFNVIPGTHTIRIFDQNGCQWDTTVMINNAEELLVNAGPDIFVPLGRSADLRADITNIIPIDTILWAPDSYDCILSNCQEIEVSPVTTQVYEVTVTDVNGCIATDDVLVSLQTSRNVYIPNAFNPNSQVTGNAFFRIFPGAGVQAINYIRIFDRWGNLVHEETNLPPSLSGSGSWDGRVNGDELEPGVYVYIVKVTYIDNDDEIRRGDITLVR